MATSHRLYCIYSTERTPGAPRVDWSAVQPTTGTGTFITPGELLQRHGRPQPTDRMEDHFRRAAREMPQLVGEHVADRFSLEPEAESVEQTPLPATSAQRLAAFRLPFGGLVACLTLEFDGDLAQVVGMLQQTTTRWQAVRLDGLDLEASLTTMGAGPDVESGDLAADVHHLLAVDPSQIPIVPSRSTGLLTSSGSNEGPGTSEPIPLSTLVSAPERLRRGVAWVAAIRQAWTAPDNPPPPHARSATETTGTEQRPPDGVDLHVAEALVFRTLDPIRSSHAEVRYPQGINRHRGMFAAVGTSVTVIPASAGELEGWLLWSAVQLTGSQARLREIRREAYDTIHQMRQERATGTSKSVGNDRYAPARRRLGELSERLGGLEEDLAGGVSAYLEIHDVLPSPMLARCHQATASLMFPAGVLATQDLLTKATTAVNARYAALAAAQRSHDEVRVRRITVVAGLLTTIALVTTIFFGFFGSNASPVDGEQSFLHADYIAFYLGLVAIVGLIGLMFVAVRRRYPLRSDDDPMRP